MLRFVCDLSLLYKPHVDLRGVTVRPEEQEQETLVYFQHLLDGGACGCHYFPFG